MINDVEARWVRKCSLFFCINNLRNSFDPFFNPSKLQIDLTKLRKSERKKGRKRIRNFYYARTSLIMFSHLGDIKRICCVRGRHNKSYEKLF